MNIAQCSSQCYDGSSNMAGSKRGVATCIQVKQPKAVLTHCYGHALNLADGDCIKQSKMCRDALDVAFEIAKLIRFSPKRWLKTYLRSTMVQSRLNHIMLLSIYKDRVDNLDLEMIGDEFVHCSEHRLQKFGHFQVILCP